jgi:hypothetical protein
MQEESNAQYSLDADDFNGSGGDQESRLHTFERCIDPMRGGEENFSSGKDLGNATVQRRQQPILLKEQLNGDKGDRNGGYPSWAPDCTRDYHRNQKTQFDAREEAEGISADL